jgi:hypothetical protein
MRTKVLLCAVALAAGLSTTMAQVYSLNVVGYYNVTVKSGKTLIANQLNTGSGATLNDIGLVLPNPPDNALVLKFKNNDYTTDIAVSGAWYDNGTGNPSTTKLAPGEGFFYDNPLADTTLTFVGEVPQGPVNVSLPSGKALVSTATPQALELSAANGFPMADNTLYLKYDNNINDYWTGIIVGGAWYDNGNGDPATIIPAVGQGYFIDNPVASTTWARTFTVQ